MHEGEEFGFTVNRSYMDNVHTTLYTEILARIIFGNLVKKKHVIGGAVSNFGD